MDFEEFCGDVSNDIMKFFRIKKISITKKLFDSLNI